MIQPLRSSRLHWLVDFVDVGEPAILPGTDQYVLPTCVLVLSETGPECIGHEILAEPDQRAAESLLARLLVERGAPDTILVVNRPEWDAQAWEIFGKNYQCRVRLLKRPDPAISPLQEFGEDVKKRFVSRLSGAAKELRRSESERRRVAESLAAGSALVQSPAKREAMLAKAVEIDPRSPEANLALADLEFNNGDLERSEALYERVLELEQGRWRDGDSSWWTNPATRPFLRGLFGRMLVAWHQGDLNSAIADGEFLLGINPTDHQGVRFLLPMLLLLAGRNEAAIQFFRDYELRYTGDFVDPGFLFAWALSATLDDRESEGAALYFRAMTRNLYIAPLLLDLPRPRPDLWHASDRAEPAYANEFFDSFAVLWDRDPSALRSLREVYLSRKADLDQLVTLRLGMQDFQDQRYDPEHQKKWKALLEEERQLTGEPENQDLPG